MPIDRSEHRRSAPSPRGAHVARRAGVLVALSAVVLVAGRASAVPVFARRYETSCQTCHVAFPKLNPFGEAFRRNGHRFPGGEDESSTKQEPVPMGQEAHKKVFPEAVWPGDLPPVAPFAVQMASSITYQPTAPRLSLATVGGSFGLNMAANLGNLISAWAGAQVVATSGATGAETTAISLERIFVTLTPLDQPYFVLRVGRIEPGVLGASMHRSLGVAPWFAVSPVRDDPFTLEPSQLGLEASGVVAAGRLAYTAGLVEGANSIVSTAKDGYGRLAYKFGGMRLDGIGGATDSAPWRETSLTVGAFAYRGQAHFGDPTVALQDDRFWMAGGDLNLLWRDANLVVALVKGRNSSPAFAAPADSPSTTQALAQLDYVLYPWLIPTVRYERRALGAPAQNRISGGAIVLIRAQARAQVLAIAQDDTGTMKLTQVIGGLNLAF